MLIILALLAPMLSLAKLLTAVLDSPSQFRKNMQGAHSSKLINKHHTFGFIFIGHSLQEGENKNFFKVTLYLVKSKYWVNSMLQLKKIKNWPKYHVQEAPINSM